MFQILTAFILNNLSKILGKSDKEILLGLASFFGASHGIYASSYCYKKETIRKDVHLCPLLHFLVGAKIRMASPLGLGISRLRSPVRSYDTLTCDLSSIISVKNNIFVIFLDALIFQF